MTSSLTCRDCGERLVLGFIPDASYATVLQSQWHPGTPEDKQFLGFKPPTVLGKSVPAIAHDPTQMLPVTAYRCPECGVLTFVAVREVEE